MNIHLCLHHKAVVIVCESDNVSKSILLIISWSWLFLAPVAQIERESKQLMKFGIFHQYILILMCGHYRVFLSLGAIALIIDESNLSELSLVSLVLSEPTYLYMFIFETRMTRRPNIDL